MGTTETRSTTETKLNRIAWLSKQDSEKEFECLMHLFNEESLFECYHSLDGNKAVGIDGVDKATYGLKLESNIKDLVDRMKKMAYQPGPVKEVLIPKEGKPGATRPLGISGFEDKMVQKMMQRVVESIYEPLFLDSSHGFRPKRGCHTAIKALQNHLNTEIVQTVIDIDLKNFFGSIDHQALEDLLKQKIKDPKLMRYINRMFKAGVLSKDEMKISEEGVPQGSVCSPIFANIFAHYALDLWVEEMVKPNCRGKVTIFRYADDAVICCARHSDAIRIRDALPKRLEKFKLQLNEEKTKLVAFSKAKAMIGIPQETFDFLGFTFYWGKSKNGRTIPKLKTKAKTFTSKLKKVATWLREHRNLPMKEMWTTFVAKLRGHVQYYGVSHNCYSVERFLKEAKRLAFKWLNRRSQRKSFTWEKFDLFLLRHPLPMARIVHKLF